MWTPPREAPSTGSTPNGSSGSCKTASRTDLHFPRPGLPKVLMATWRARRRAEALARFVHEPHEPHERARFRDSAKAEAQSFQPRKTRKERRRTLALSALFRVFRGSK